MINGVICSLVGTLFLLVLYSLFNSKLKINNAKSKLYKLMIIVLLILSFLLMASELTLENYNDIFIADTLMVIHWRGSFILIILLYYYLIYFISDLKYNKIIDIFKNIKYVKVTTIIMIILFLISFIVPMDYKIQYEYNYFPGTFGIYLQGYIIISLLMFIIYYKWFNQNKVNKIDKPIVIGITLIYIIFVICQLSITEVSFYGLAFTTILYFLYSTSENPDLEMITSLKKLNQEIIDSNNAKTDIILNMSHDIRSPMNAIVNYSSRLTEINDNKEAIDSIDNILIASKNLLSILDDILEMSGKESLTKETIYSVDELINELSSITMTTIGNKPVKLYFNVEEGTPKLLIGSYAKIYRILMNILTNSAKYTEVGKIIFDIKSKRINDSNILLKFSISDTGFGIKNEDKSKVFSEYSRLKDATNQKIEGTGLGIANTKKNVELLGGKIWFESTYGAGSTFYVDIPQKVCKSKTIEEYVNENAIHNNKLLDCSNYKVLVVDDNKVNINVAIRLLKKYNFNIEYVYSGRECIDKIKEGNKYDLIFLDLMMSDVDGEEVLNVLKYLDKQYELPKIVALTANVLSGARDTYLEKGFDEYLAKPIDIKELNRIINMFFNK